MTKSKYKDIQKDKLQNLFEKYINESRYSTCLRSETIRGYEAVFRLFKKVMPEVSDVDSLTEARLNEFFRRIQNRSRVIGKDQIRKGVKNSTIKTQRSKLNVFFKWLLEKGLIQENPLKNIKSPKVSYNDFKRLEDSEIHKTYSAITLNHVNELLQKRDTMMVSLLLFVGLRKGEFISLQTRDIDLAQKKITIRGETSKSGVTRELVLHDTLIVHLKEYLKLRKNFKTEYLIVSNRGDRGLSREGLKHWVEALKKKSGVKFHLHQFRHTFACKLAEKNVNLFKIQKLMGHTDIKMTMKYARSLQTEDMAEDIAKISI